MIVRQSLLMMVPTSQFYSFSLLLLLSYLISSYSFSCLDESGLPVDSWVALTQDDDYQYYFHHPINGFEKSMHRLNQTSLGAIMSTVEQLYTNKLNLSDAAYALYNDDPPTDVTPSSTYAHSKGMILTNSTQGFWLVHSKPNWPNPRDSNATTFPDSTYAQSIMCVNFNISTINLIAAAQMTNFPYVYDSHLGDNLVVSLPLFKEWAIDNEKSSTFSDINSFTSAGGIAYTHFAKSKTWGKDLYADLVAPSLNSSLAVETWRLGSGGRMGSMCVGAYPYYTIEHDIFEVSTVTMPDGASWAGTKDHSKWASTFESAGSSGALPIKAVCIADTNRMCSQENRGGGALCVDGDFESLWTSFNDAINNNIGVCSAIDPCDGVGSQCHWCPENIPTAAPTYPPDSFVEKGDIAIMSFNSDNPDTFAVVALNPIASGNMIKFTDNGWDSTAFRSTEGILSFRLSTPMPAGTVFYYNGVNMTNDYGSWETVSGTFSLSASGDQLFLYTGDESTPNFLYGLTTTPWLASGEAASASTSVLPDELAAAGILHYYVEFVSGTPDNLVYSGASNGTASMLLQLLNDVNQWTSSSSVGFDVEQIKDFTIYEDPLTLPTVAPSSVHTSPHTPTAHPNYHPSLVPTAGPTATVGPTVMDTYTPTMEPTEMHTNTNTPGGPPTATGGGGGGGAGSGLVECDPCGASATYNETFVMEGSIMIRNIDTTGCPNHYNYCTGKGRGVCGTFGVEGSGTEAKEVNSLFQIPAFPIYANTSVDVTCSLGAIGVILNGVKVFGPAVNQACDFIDTTTTESEWTGFDFCSGHVSVDGSYHYHFAPSCLIAQAVALEPIADGHSPQIGWSLDGFPVYGPHGVGGMVMMYTTSGCTGDLCLDSCGGFEMWIPELDDYKYRYYFTGNTSDLTTLPTSPLPALEHTPTSWTCYKGCTVANMKDGTCNGVPGYNDTFVPFTLEGYTDPYVSPYATDKKCYISSSASIVPTVVPTAMGSETPMIPSYLPNYTPTLVPSREPSVQPTAMHTDAPVHTSPHTPTAHPNYHPSLVPTAGPTATVGPTVMDTYTPTMEPTEMHTNTNTPTSSQITSSTPTASSHTTSTPTVSVTTSTLDRHSCMAGTYLTVSWRGSSEERSCMMCPAGRYSAANQTDCTICGEGSFSSEMSGECSTCPVDFYSLAGASTCTQCRPGTYSTGGSSACTSYPACDPGQWRAHVDAALCSACPAGFYGLGGDTPCVMCEAGTIAGEGSSSCTPCTDGEFSPPGNDTCRTCSSSSSSSTTTTRKLDAVTDTKMLL